MQNKLMLAEIQPEASECSLLELSASEVRALMQRFGVRSEACPEELELMDLMLALQDEGLAVVPPPQFVPLTSERVH